MKIVPYVIVNNFCNSDVFHKWLLEELFQENDLHVTLRSGENTRPR